MKKKLLILAVLLIFISILGCGTLAYTAAEGRAVNVITSGGVDIRLDETGADGLPFPAEGIRGVVPGGNYGKIVEVANIGGQTAWIRVKVEAADFVSLDYNDTHWQEKDGWFYYLHPLAPGAVTVPLFKTVRFSPQMDDSWQGRTLRVGVLAMATQAENNGKTVWAAKGWPKEG